MTTTASCTAHTGSQPPAHTAHFEVVSKRPVAQHFKECVVIKVPAHVVQIVVLPAGADTLLAVDHAAVGGQLAAGVRRAQEDGLELRGQCRQVSTTAAAAAAMEEKILFKLLLMKLIFKRQLIFKERNFFSPLSFLAIMTSRNVSKCLYDD